MSGVRGRDGKRITRTVTYLLKCPASSMPQAMGACKYSNKESSDAAKQMAVRQEEEEVPSPLSNLHVVCVPN